MTRGSLLGMMLMGLSLALPACNAPSNPAPQPLAASVTDAPVMKESPAAFTDRYNGWLLDANALIEAGYKAASEAVSLEEGEEWGCEWEMDGKAVRAAVRKAVKGNDLFAPALQERWLSILDSADREGALYGAGSLLVMGRFDPNCWGEKLHAVYLDMPDAQASDAGDSRFGWRLEDICAGQSLTGQVTVHVQRLPDGRLQMLDATFSPD
jgi:hypothetical protein